MASEFDIADPKNYLDSARYAEYCLKIHTIIEKAKHALSIAEIRRELGENDKREWDMNALDSLMAVGSIREFQSGALQRYEPAIRHERNHKDFGRQCINTEPVSPTFVDRRA